MIVYQGMERQDTVVTRWVVRRSLVHHSTGVDYYIDEFSSEGYSLNQQHCMMSGT